MPKSLELNVINPQTDRNITSCFDASFVVAIQRETRGGTDEVSIVFASGMSMKVAESYESLKKRWHAARELEAGPAVPAAGGKGAVLVS